MAKNKLVLEHDEKKSIIIALIVSAVVILALVLTFVALRGYQEKHGGTVIESNPVVESTETAGDLVYSGDVVVTNQEELNAALENENVTSISFESGDTQSVVIPTGDYSTITFSINAPQTEVTNYGVFAAVTIYQIAANTWTESVSGNAFIINAVACHMIVPSGIEVKSIEAMQDNSTVAIEISGTVSLLALEGTDSIVSIQEDGVLSQMIIYASTNLALQGSPTSIIPIEVAYGADGSILDLAVPANVVSYSNATINFNAGAEESTVTASSDTGTVTVSNYTNTDINFTFPDGSVNVVVPEGTLTYDGSQGNSSGGTNEAVDSSSDTTSSESSNSGSSGSGSSGSSSSGSSSSGNKTTSSGGTVVNGYSQSQVDQMISAAVNQATAGMISATDVAAMIESAKNQAVLTATQDMISKDEARELINNAVLEAQKQIEDEIKKESAKPTIVRFSDIADIYGGKEGSTKAFSMVKAELDAVTSVTGQTAEGELIEVPVIQWNNYNSYNEDDSQTTSIKAGTYRFIATLQTSDQYSIASGLMAEVKVYVQAAEITGSGQIIYEDEAMVDLMPVTEYWVEDSENVKAGEPDAYYVVHNNSDSKILVYLEFDYFDSNGEEILRLSESHDGKYVQPQQRLIIKRDKPSEEYNYCIVTVHTAQGNIESAAIYADCFFNETRDAIIVRKKNETPGTLVEVTLQVLYIKDNKVYGTQQFTTGNGSPSIKSIENGESIVINSSYNLQIPSALGTDNPLLESIISMSGGYMK